MQIINLKFKDNGCALKLMEKMSNIFERSGDNPPPPPRKMLLKTRQKMRKQHLWK